MKSNYYSSYNEAKKAVQRLAINTSTKYNKYYKIDPKLPANPTKIYKNDWESWPIFLRNENKFFYETLQEAIKATKSLNIFDRVTYNKRYKEDSRLPADPSRCYFSDWDCWTVFFGNKRKTFYKTYAEAKKATKILEINSGDEYRIRYKEDCQLAAAPDAKYKEDWLSWPNFLDHRTKEFYSCYYEASEAAQLLKISSCHEYSKRYKNDSRLPCEPKSSYPEDWSCWSDFLNAKKNTFYSNYSEASLSAQSLKIYSQIDYKKKYKKDTNLPSCPYIIYKDNWKGWIDFLLPKEVNNLNTLKQCCKIIGIKNSIQYKKSRKEYSNLPSKPENLPTWKNWYDALDIPRPYSYEKLRNLVLKKNCTNMKEYHVMRKEMNDPRIHSKPNEYYENWSNTYDFFGNPRPYQVKYFYKEWHKWAEKISEFLKLARGGNAKTKDVCEFVREYIEPNGLDKDPLEFVTRRKTNIQPMLDLFSNVSVVRKKKWLCAINQFIDWLITNYLLLEDEETGEIVPIKGANNPFSLINFDDEKISQVANETNKLALPYQFVKSGREWIFPPNAPYKKVTYKELLHLHPFSADWVEIPSSTTLDPNDPDCVFKIEGDKTYIWLPIYWTYTFALMQLPARGMQIIYCDSGEADIEQADFVNGKLVWKKNNSKLAGLTKSQGMISKAGHHDFGVYYTSNKTMFGGTGYSVPFMPEELAYWLIKLRKWQHKYNSISQPTKWSDCTRTNLNEVQLKLKGENCFLFRDFREIEPGSFGGRLATRLAAALFFSGKNEITIATCNGETYLDTHEELKNRSNISLNHFKSLYTPHSMRVSLINAYAYEFGMPLEVIMKLVGHSSIIMSIYYIKSDRTGANIRERIVQGEKQALSNATKTLKTYIDQQRIEECKSQLTANSSEFFSNLNNNRPASSYQFKDFGVCPTGGAFCSEGGDHVASKANIFHPVPSGYLGEQNCIKCRFFVTGPAFMMGLAALFNEISLSVNTQSLRYTELEEQLCEITDQIEIISHQLYEKMQRNTESDQLQVLITQRHKLNSEIETKAKKLDLYMSDMNAIHKHITHCQSLMKQQTSVTDSKLQLIIPKSFDLDYELDEVSYFHQLSEVCENAEIFHSCSDDLAVNRRSQALDRMMMMNNIQPKLLLLNEKEQLIIGNQLTKLMYSRLKSWECIDRLIKGTLMLRDVDEETGFNKQLIQQLFSNSQPMILVD